MEVSRLHDGCTFIENNGKYFIVRNSEAITPRYDWLRKSEFGYWVFKLNGKYGFLDSNYKEIVSAKYSSMPLWINGFSKMYVDGKGTIINKDLEEIIPLKYDRVYFFAEDLTRVELNGKCGFINKTGKEEIPLMYDDFERLKETVFLSDLVDFGNKPPYFWNGLIKAKLNGKWGIINKKNQIVLPMKYDKILYNDGDFFKVILNGKVGLINKNFAEIVQPMYDEIGEFGEIHPDAAKVRNGLWVGFINKLGQETLKEYSYTMRYNPLAHRITVPLPTLFDDERYWPEYLS